MADTPWVIVSTSLHHYVKTASGREVAAVIRPIHDLAKTPAELEQTQAFQDALRIVNAVNAAGTPAPAVPPNIRTLVDDFGLSVVTWRNSKKGQAREQAHRDSIAAKRALLNAYSVDAPPAPNQQEP